jgi:hypothetical protein
LHQLPYYLPAKPAAKVTPDRIAFVRGPGIAACIPPF